MKTTRLYGGEDQVLCCEFNACGTIDDGTNLSNFYCNLASWGVVWYGSPGKAAPAAVAAAAAAAGNPAAAPGSVAYVYGVT